MILAQFHPDLLCFALRYGRGTLRPLLPRVQQRTKFLREAHWVTMLRAGLVATLMSFDAPVETSFNAVDNLLSARRPPYSVLIWLSSF